MQSTVPTALLDRGAAPPRTRIATAEDFPQIATLFQSVFRNGQGLHRPSLIEAMRALYLGAPWYDADLGPIVHADKDGVINGFMGMQPLPMLWRDRPIRARVLSSFMVADPARNPTVAHRMISAFMAGPQDLAVSDTTNLTSLNLAERVGFAIGPDSNLRWCRVLRPVAYGHALLGRRLPRAFARMTGWPARAADRVIAQASERRASGFAPTIEPGITDDNVNADQFAASAERLSASAFAVRPDWGGGGLLWQLGLAAQKRELGSLQMREVRGKADAVIGAYLYYCKAGGIGTVLHILAAPRMAAAVIGALCAHADASGCVAVQGQTSPAIMPGLFRTKNVFYRHVDSTIVFARDPALMQDVLAGRAMLGGLVGDTWTRLSSDSFA